MIYLEVQFDTWKTQLSSPSSNHIEQLNPNRRCVLLILTPGILTFAGRTPTAENIDNKLAMVVGLDVSPEECAEYMLHGMLGTDK
jgi:hypothetical protein